REVEAGRTPNDIGAWLHRVGSNLVNSRGRHLSVVDRRAGELARPSMPVGPEEVALDVELARALQDALRSMPAEHRRALVLAAHGYHGDEIAAAIGRTPGATRTLLCRARARMRETLMIAGFAPA
ncbi:MAG: sigma-70 family RNA polymerase sigma factor, partial [Candidatus Limnocylindrales bacterium]